MASPGVSASFPAVIRDPRECVVLVVWERLLKPSVFSGFLSRASITNRALFSASLDISTFFPPAVWKPWNEATAVEFSSLELSTPIPSAVLDPGKEKLPPTTLIPALSWASSLLSFWTFDFTFSMESSSGFTLFFLVFWKLWIASGCRCIISRSISSIVLLAFCRAFSETLTVFPLAVWKPWNELPLRFLSSNTSEAPCFHFVSIPLLACFPTCSETSTLVVTASLLSKPNDLFISLMVAVAVFKHSSDSSIFLPLAVWKPQHLGTTSSSQEGSPFLAELCLSWKATLSHLMMVSLDHWSFAVLLSVLATRTSASALLSCVASASVQLTASLLFESVVAAPKLISTSWSNPLAFSRAVSETCTGLPAAVRKPTNSTAEHGFSSISLEQSWKSLGGQYSSWQDFSVQFSCPEVDRAYHAFFSLQLTDEATRSFTSPFPANFKSWTEEEFSFGLPHCPTVPSDGFCGFVGVVKTAVFRGSEGGNDSKGNWLRASISTKFSFSAVLRPPKLFSFSLPASLCKCPWISFSYAADATLKIVRAFSKAFSDTVTNLPDPVRKPKQGVSPVAALHAACSAVIVISFCSTKAWNKELSAASTQVASVFL